MKLFGLNIHTWHVPTWIGVQYRCIANFNFDVAKSRIMLIPVWSYSEKVGARFSNTDSVESRKSHIGCKISA